MSSRKQAVGAYFDGFRASDHEAILALLSEDVIWVIHGHGRREGKQAFDREIENDAFVGSPKLTVERLKEKPSSLRASSPTSSPSRDSPAGVESTRRVPNARLPG